MAEHWVPDWEAVKESEANGLGGTFIPTAHLPFFDDEGDLLDAEGWDDLETAAWLEQNSWADIRGDDPLDAFEV